MNAVTGATDGADWLRNTAKVNQLLIGLDHTGSWYRDHHLLRDLLRLEAQQALPGQLNELHKRAAAWFESEGDLSQAVAHQLAAGDQNEAGRLMFAYGPMLIADGQFDTLRGILEKVGDVAKTMTWCTLAWGWCEAISGRYSQAEAWVQATHDVDPDGFDQTLTASLRMNIFLDRGDVGSALTIARELDAAGVFESNTPVLATVAGDRSLSRSWDRRPITDSHRIEAPRQAGPPPVDFGLNNSGGEPSSIAGDECVGYSALESYCMASTGFPPGSWNAMRCPTLGIVDRSIRIVPPAATTRRPTSSTSSTPKLHSNPVVGPSARSCRRC